MKILNNKSKNFDKILDVFLLKRKKKLQASSVSVTKIINDVKRNGDKALLKYEKKFNKNKIIVPTSNQISKSIKSLIPTIRKLVLLVTLFPTIAPLLTALWIASFLFIEASSPVKTISVSNKSLP